MIRRNTWILLGVFGCSLLVAWFFEQGIPVGASQTPTATTETPKAVLQGLTTQDATGLQIRKGNGELLELTRNAKGGWILKGYPKTAVNQGSVEELLAELTTMRVVTTLENSPSLQDLGLASPVETITITGALAGQKVLQVGAGTATGAGYYARVDNGPFIVVNQESVDRILELFSAGALTAIDPTLQAISIPPGTLAP